MPATRTDSARRAGPRPRRPLWFVEALDLLDRRRHVALVVVGAVVTLAALLAIFAPGLLPGNAVAGASVATGGLLLGVAAAVAVDSADLTVRGPRHVRASGAELVAVLPTGADADQAHELAGAILEARDGNGRSCLRIGLVPAGVDPEVVAAWADAIAVALARQGVSVLSTDVSDGPTDVPGICEVIRDGAKLPQVVTYDDELLLARLGAGRDHTGALGCVPDLVDQLPRDLDLLVAALPPVSTRGTLVAASALDHVLVVAGRDLTRRVDLVAALDAVESRGPGAQVVLLDDQTLRLLGAGPEAVAAPTDEAPQDSAPQDSAPQDSAPQDSAPQDSAPQDSAPQDGQPADSAPQDSAPQDSAPQGGQPADGAPPRTEPPPGERSEGTPAASLEEHDGRYERVRLVRPPVTPRDAAEEAVAEPRPVDVLEEAARASALQVTEHRMPADEPEDRDAPSAASEPTPRDAVVPAASAATSPDVAVSTDAEDVSAEAPAREAEDLRAHADEPREVEDPAAAQEPVGELAVAGDPAVAHEPDAVEAPAEDPAVAHEPDAVEAPAEDHPTDELPAVNVFDTAVVDVPVDDLLSSDPDDDPVRTTAQLAIFLEGVDQRGNR